MTLSVVHTAVLACHPGTQSRAVHGIEARLSWHDGGALALTYVLKGELSCLRIPPPGPVRRADRLWQHTCFEAFISVKGDPAYREFNFAPSGEWAAYAFRSYRESAPLAAEGPAPGITMRRTESSLDLDAVIRPDCLPATPRHGRLRLALSAVIEEEDGMISYWALRHPPGQPDFHHPDAFALKIE